MNLDQYEAWAAGGMLKQAEELELIGLARRQESELMDERDMSARLTTALEQSQAAYGKLALELAELQAKPLPNTPGDLRRYNRETGAPPITDAQVASAMGAIKRNSVDENKVIVDRRDLFEFIRLAWRAGQEHHGEMDEVDRLVKGGDYANNVITNWRTLRTAAPQQHAQAALSDEQRLKIENAAHVLYLSQDYSLAADLRAILAASHQPAAAPEDATDAMAMAVRHYDIFDVLPDTALRAVAKSIYRDMLSAAPAQPEIAREAARYRYLRDEHIGDDPESINLTPGPKSGLDSAVDAAIATGEKQ